MGKKSLEQLFKEVFKEYHETPDENVWKAIEASLDKKEQKKRVIPIWWKLGGVVAALALLFLMVNPFATSNNGDVIITDIENNAATTKDVDNFEQPNASSESLVESSTGEASESNDNIRDEAEENMLKNQGFDAAEQLASSQNAQKSTSASNRNQNGNGLAKSDAAQLALVNTSKTQNNPNTEKTATNHAITDALDVENSVVENQLKQQDDVKEAIGQDLENVGEKKSIFEVIEEQEKEAVAENASSKWSVGPSVAPVYFSAAGTGSPIHSIFSTNSKSGNVNLSYGVTVAYNVGKKLKVRSGVHKVDYGYDTNDVAFSSLPNAGLNGQIDNIDYQRASRSIVVESKKAPTQRFSNDASAELASNQNPSFDGKMIQQLGYIEVPVELDYSLIDKKIGINLIGGVSSLFLVDNSVLLESNDLITEVGEANNANTVNFSTNVGLGFNYEFTPKFQLNLEPIFKYQLSTFSETAGSFRPFSVGVYSGVRFKF